MSEKNEPKFKKAGAKPKISQEIIDKICNTLRAGSYLETAAAMAGVGKTSLFKWLKKGNAQPNSIYGQLLNSVERAQAESEVRDLLNIDASAMGRKAEYERDKQGNLVYDGEGNPIIIKYGAKPSWQASAWRLERKHPKRWGRLDRTELSNNPEAPITGSQITIMLPKKKELPE